MSLCVMAMSESSSARRKFTRRVTPRTGKNTLKRDTKPGADLEKPRTSDDLDKDTLVSLFGADYLEELEDLDEESEEDDFEEDEEEVQTPSPSPPPPQPPLLSQPSRPKRVKIPISADPLEKTCIEKDPLPAGYIFVRRGDVYITRHCRSKTKDSKRTVYLVYDAKGKHTLGIRVPKDIYDSVRSDATATASSRADAVKVRDERDLTRSRKLLLAQFPKIPPSSLETILEHAFLKGSGRVGRSTKRSDERKAELAVEAHIRHLHTPYEELLDEGMQRDEARDRVWDAVQEVKAAWGGQRRHSPLPSKRIKRKRSTKAPGTKVAKKAKKK